jgi:hypothetical protein
VINHVAAPPLLAGAVTVTMAREVYGIADPADEQMRLFRILRIQVAHKPSLVQG